MDRWGRPAVKSDDVEAKNVEACYALIEKDECVLMVRPAVSHIWELPGGKGAEDEESVRLMMRKLLEDTGIETEPHHLTMDKQGTIPLDADEVDEYWNYHLKIFKLDSSVAGDPTPPEGVEELKWMPIADIADYAMHYVHREILRSIYEK